MIGIKWQCKILPVYEESLIMCNIRLLTPNDIECVDWQEVSWNYRKGDDINIWVKKMQKAILKISKFKIEITKHANNSKLFCINCWIRIMMCHTGCNGCWGHKITFIQHWPWNCLLAGGYYVLSGERNIVLNLSYFLFLLWIK